MYVYKRTEFPPYCLYTVGYYEPNGEWQTDSDHETTETAAERVAWLNGSRPMEQEIISLLIEQQKYKYGSNAYNALRDKLGTLIPNIIKEQAALKNAECLFASLSDEERLALWANYCKHCGCYEGDMQMGCQCWNDE